MIAPWRRVRSKDFSRQLCAIGEFFFFAAVSRAQRISPAPKCARRISRRLGTFE